MTVVALMVVVRPAAVFACTVRTGLSVREKLFLSWCAPRGIVAAAVASLFALELSGAGIEGGAALRTLVFLVIAITVTAQGLTGGLVAGLLGVRSARNLGYVVLGANPLALHIAGRLAAAGEPVVIIDSNADATRAARDAGFAALTGNGLDERTLTAAHTEVRRGCIGLTRNESVNLLFARRVTEDFTGPSVHVAMDTDNPGVTAGLVARIDARILFGGVRGLHHWVRQWERGNIELVRCTSEAGTLGGQDPLSGPPRRVLLPLVRERGKAVELIDELSGLRRGDIVEFAVDAEARDAAMAWLNQSGWRPVA